MIYAPDAGRLRGLFARPFKRGPHTAAHRDLLTHRLEPSFDPIPQAAAESRELPSVAAPDRTPPYTPAKGPRTERQADTPTRPRARYGLPGAHPSDVFGPYALSAEAELSIDIDDEQESENAPATGHARAPDNLVDRLTRALSDIETGDEKNSGFHFDDRRQTRPDEGVSRSQNGGKVMTRDEELEQKSSTDSSK